MNILLDTHVVIWWLENSDRLRPTARKAIEEPKNNAWISAVSVWEISIKISIGRLVFRAPPETGITSMLDQGFRSLPTGSSSRRHSAKTITLLTTDPWMRAYNVRTIDAST